MARKSRFRRARRRYSKRRRQQGRKKKLRLSLRQAKSRKIDNSSERILVALSKRVAKAEVAKAHPSLVFRKYIWGNYDQNTNLFVGGVLVDWDGIAPHHICQIPLTDMASLVNVPPIVDPAFVLPQENQATQFDRPAGVNFVAPRFQLDGTRLGYKIKLRSFELEIRAQVDQFVAATPMLIESTIVKWALVSVNNDATPLQASQINIERVLPMKKMGYTSKIDKVELEKTSKFRHRTLAKGSFKMRISAHHPNLLFKKWRVNMKNRSYEYSSMDPLAGGRAQDQTGQRVIGGKIFLCIRCTTPTGAAFAPYQPSLIAAYKVRYTNVV